MFSPCKYICSPCKYNSVSIYNVLVLLPAIRIKLIVTASQDFIRVYAEIYKPKFQRIQIYLDIDI